MITITKNKIYSSPFSLKSTSPDSKAVKEIEIADIIYNLGESLEIGEDVTFSRLFDLIIFHKEFFNILFKHEMKGLVIDDFIFDYEKEVMIFQKNQEYKLRLMWVCDVYEYDGEVDFIDYVSLDAFGMIDKTIDKENYGISIAFSSLAEIKDSLIFINNTFDIQDSNTYKNEIESIFKANYRDVTVYQIIAAILREICFYGNPDERDARRMELEKRNEDIQKWIEEGTIDEHTKTWNDVNDELDEIIEENYTEEDKTTFWDTLYPKEKLTDNNSKDAVDNVIIALSEGSNMSLDEQLQEAHDSENYEKAAKLKKLIDKRDGNKTD